MPDFATNVRRLMARQGYSVLQLVERSTLDERTVKNILNGTNRRPHARTLYQLAVGLGVETDELYQNDGSVTWRTFDRDTNPLVDEVVQSRPELFEGWSALEFDELCSHFGAGGALTFDGVVTTVARMNQKRDVLQKVSWLLETDARDVLGDIVEAIYRRSSGEGGSMSTSEVSTESRVVSCGQPKQQASCLVEIPTRRGVQRPSMAQT